MNILYTINDTFVPQLAAGVMSVIMNNKDIKEINFYVISDGISSKNKKLLEKMCNKYKRKIIFLELGDINDYIDFSFDTSGWNQIVLARLLLDKFLPDTCDKVLYLDGDTIVRDSLEELWDIDLKNNVIGASIEPTVNRNNLGPLNLEGYPYYNAGVLLVNLKLWRKENIGKKILEFYKKNDGKLFANDQDAINGTLKGRIYTLSPRYNYYNIFYTYSYRFLNRLMGDIEYVSKDVFDYAKKNPAIIHYLGEERPWRRYNHHKYKDDYFKYLNMTHWKDCELEEGWRLYFICWDLFNFVMRPFPGLRYRIITMLIPMFLSYRKRKLKK